MGPTQSIYSSQSTQVNNEILQDINSECVQTNTAEQSGNMFIITDSIGNFTLGQKVTVNARCVIANNIESQLVNSIVQDSTNSLKNEKGLFGIDFSTADQNIKNIQTVLVTNKISQIIRNNCVQTVNAQQNNNIIIVKGLLGNFNFVQSVDNVNSDCQISNVASAGIENNIQQSADNSAKNVTSLAVILIIIIIIVALFGGFFVVLKAGTAFIENGGVEAIANGVNGGNGLSGGGDLGSLLSSL